MSNKYLEKIAFLPALGSLGKLALGGAAAGGAVGAATAGEGNRVSGALTGALTGATLGAGAGKLLAKPALRTIAQPKLLKSAKIVGLSNLGKSTLAGAVLGGTTGAAYAGEDNRIKGALGGVVAGGALGAGVAKLLARKPNMKNLTPKLLSAPVKRLN